MIQRWETNGSATNSDRQQNQLNGHSQAQPLNPAEWLPTNIPTGAIKESVEGFVKKSPAKSLLIAAAAGLAIGWLVKR